MQTLFSSTYIDAEDTRDNFKWFSRHPSKNELTHFKHPSTLALLSFLLHVQLCFMLRKNYVFMINYLIEFFLYVGSSFRYYSLLYYLLVV